jgi:DNA modification methylase
MLCRNTIIKGACLDILPQLSARSVDFVLTEPPYITRYKVRDGRTVPNDDNAAGLKPAPHSEASIRASIKWSRHFRRRAD